MACTCLVLALTGTFAARLPDALLPDELNFGRLWLRFRLWCFPAQAAQQARAGARTVCRRLLRRLGRKAPEAEPEPETPEVKLVRQQRVRQSRSKRSGKR